MRRRAVYQILAECSDVLSLIWDFDYRLPHAQDVIQLKSYVTTRDDFRSPLFSILEVDSLTGLVMKRRAAFKLS